jgi:DNA-directed RNA polymerase subunit RPC12/RpoP
MRTKTDSWGSIMKTVNCPRCHHELDEGPIMYRCAHCRRAVYAADVENEYVPREPVAA